MAAWPGGTVASLWVLNYEGGNSLGQGAAPGAAIAQQTVTDVHIDFTVDISYGDHPYFDHGRAFFRVGLDRLTLSGWQTVDTQSKTLGDGDHDGDWSDSIVVSVTMVDQFERYRLHLYWTLGDIFAPFDAPDPLTMEIELTAVQGEVSIGTFSLDFLPTSIVYCPPGQDMTASLTQSETYGTRFTVGES